MSPPRLLHFADLETIYDDPERLGRLAGAIDAARDDRTVVVGSGDTSALGALAFESDAGREAARPFYEHVEPTADTLGNHEFDQGVGDAVEWANTTPGQHLVANVAGVAAGDGGRWPSLQPSTVTTCAGHRIGLVGIAHPDHVHGDFLPNLPNAVSAVTSVVLWLPTVSSLTVGGDRARATEFTVQRCRRGHA